MMGETDKTSLPCKDSENILGKKKNSTDDIKREVYLLSFKATNETSMIVLLTC